MKIEFDFPVGTWIELLGNFSADADASHGHMYVVYRQITEAIEKALHDAEDEDPGLPEGSERYLEHEYGEPPIEEYDPGPEVDDEGGMSEHRHGIDSEEPEDRYVPDPDRYSPPPIFYGD